MQMADAPVTYLILTIKTANCTVHKKLQEALLKETLADVRKTYRLYLSVP
jgi:hypothetical protein